MADSFLKKLRRSVAAVGTAFQLEFGAFGYASGGTVVQQTNKGTGVTLNQPTGEITLNNANLASLTAVSFVLTNNYIELGDYLAVQHVSGGTVGVYNCVAVCAAGSATITVFNITAGGLAEAIVLKYVLWKAKTSTP